MNEDIEQQEGRNPRTVAMVNAAAYGALGLAATAAIAGTRKLLNKANSANIRWLPPVGLWISAGLATFIGITAYIGIKRENTAIQADVDKLLSDPALVKDIEQGISHWKQAGSPEDKQAVIDGMLSKAADEQSTKHRDSVVASRVASSTELGA